MDRVMRGEGAERRRAGVRRRSDAAREDEVRRLKSIHDTYADRMQILSLIYQMDSGQQASISPDHHEDSPDYEHSTGFHTEPYSISNEHEYDDVQTPAETIGSAFVSYDRASGLDYAAHHATRAEHILSFSPSPSPSPSPDDYDHATPTEYQPTPISPTSTITPQRERGSHIPPMRPIPNGPLPLPSVQPLYSLPQPPSQPQAQWSNGAPAPARVNRSQSTSAGSGSRTDSHSPHRRSYAVPPSAPAHVQTQPSRMRTGSAAGHKRSGSGNERLGLGPLAEERERDREASSGTESEPWTVVPTDLHSHQQPVAEGYRSTSEAYRSRVMSLGRDAGTSIAREMRELPPHPSGSPITPRLPISNVDVLRSGAGVDVIQRPRGDTSSSTSSRGSDGPSSAGTVSTVPTSFSASVEKSSVIMPGPNSSAMENGMLVNTSTSQGSIAQRRRSAQPSISHSSALQQALQQQQPQLPALPQTPTSSQQTPIVSVPPPSVIPSAPTTRLTADALPAGAATRLGIAPGRLRASSQPGRRPDMPTTNVGSSLASGPRKSSTSHSRVIFGRGMASPVPWGVALGAAGIPLVPAQSTGGSPSLVVHIVGASVPLSTKPAPPPDSQHRRPFYLMGCLLVSLTRQSGGYLTPKLHVPHEVWSQGGAKLVNVPDKLRVLESLVDHLIGLRECSEGFFSGRRGGEEFLKRLEEWTKHCDSLNGEYSKKLGVGEGVIKKRGGMTDKIMRGFDRITNGKSVDSPANYAELLKRLFTAAELFDKHILALQDRHHPRYLPVSSSVRNQIEMRLHAASEFFATVVLTFVVRDLGLLMDKFVKKTDFRLHYFCGTGHSVTANTPTKMEKARQILKDVFQFPSFRLAQEQAIERLVVHNKSALVLFPTAGGKSPLISLMRDQVDALVRRRVKAASWDSTLTAEQAKVVKDGVLSGDLKLLYVAPENESTCATNGAYLYLPFVCSINLLAVDESHCISQWGASFRPEYLKIARFVEEFNISRVLCLTATATNQVAEDICNSFHIDTKAGIFKVPVYRPNLAFRVKSHTTECQSRLRARGIESEVYHAGLPSETRTNVQSWFMASADGIVVCTIAFGMGIDKVIHLYMPKTLENYSQEVGRAGRDGKPSVCTLFLCAADIPILENFARGDTISPNNILLWLTAGVFGIPLAPDGALEPTVLLNLYAQLELKFGLLRAITPCYQIYDYTIRDEKSWAKLDKSSKEAKTVLQYVQPRSSGYHIDVSLAAEHSGVPRADLTRVIQNWELSKAIEVKASQVRHRYRVLKELPSGNPALLSAIANQLYDGQLIAENEAMEKIQGVLRFATGDECLAHSLAVYFGDEKAVPYGSCGACTQCLTGEGVEFNPNYIARVDPIALRNILDTCLDRDDPRMIARFAIGITSPRLTASKLTSHTLFGSMVGVNWGQLFTLIDAECFAAGYTPAPDGSYDYLRQRHTSRAQGSKTTTTKATSTRGRSLSGNHSRKPYKPYDNDPSFYRGSHRGARHHVGPTATLNVKKFGSGRHPTGIPSYFSSTSSLFNNMAVKRGVGSDNPKEEKPWVLEVRELEPEEEKLMKELERKLAALKILKPLYESRRKTFASQKNFWGIALGQHSEIGQHLLDSKDAEAMTYLRDVWVERDPNEHRHFDENPFFSNNVLKKYYKYSAPPEVSPEDSTPDANGVTNVMIDFNWERDIDISGTEIEWKDPANALTKLRPRPDMEEIEKRLKDDDEPISIDTGSFFHYFEEKDDEFDIGQTIAEEVFADAIGYFTGTHENARNNLEDSDWEDDDDE
ncbi:ATP-dependent DNA helicase recQ [Rhizoctonia solani AG-1 IA]|uniref:DNA 3'-5' helicase n=1 Tax=Thanatephorus cucumeris (strain AG1-IA) TaxID=983506 RepID=L8X7A4_THACA|nr:ATP-dependent DNA helicase recQ [Rhizoctonia solani AG-1 IA]